MQKLIRLLFSFILNRYRETAVRMIKIKCAMFYVTVIKALRLSIVGVIVASVIFSFFTVGLLLLHGALFAVLPWTMQKKLVFFIILGLVYTLVPLILFLTITSERLWMRASGASRMVDDALKGKCD